MAGKGRPIVDDKRDNQYCVRLNDEEDYECVSCGRIFRIKGCIIEYPIGAYDSEMIDISKKGLANMNSKEEHNVRTCFFR